MALNTWIRLTQRVFRFIIHIFFNRWMLQSSAPYKDTFRDAVNETCNNGIGAINKQHFLELYRTARAKLPKVIAPPVTPPSPEIPKSTISVR